MFSADISKKIELLKGWNLSEEERKVMRCLYGAYREGKGKLTQRDIAKSEAWMGSHPRFEDYSVTDTTLRKVRQIIRDLRLNHNAPILSDRDGYWIPSREEEVTEYLDRIEQEAKAQTKAWFETYKAMKFTFGATSDFFEQMRADIL